MSATKESPVAMKAEGRPDKLDLIGKAINKAGAQVFGLLATYEPSIQAAYITSKEDKVSIGLTIELSPSTEKPDTIVTRTKINFIESRIKDELSDQVSNQRELPLGEA